MWQPLGGRSHEKRRTRPGTPRTIAVRELWRSRCRLQFPAIGMFLCGPSSKCHSASSLFFTRTRYPCKSATSIIYWTKPEWLVLLDEENPASRFNGKLLQPEVISFDNEGHLRNGTLMSREARAIVKR